MHSGRSRPATAPVPKAFSRQASMFLFLPTRHIAPERACRIPKFMSTLPRGQCGALPEWLHVELATPNNKPVSGADVRPESRPRRRCDRAKPQEWHLPLEAKCLNGVPGWARLLPKTPRPKPPPMQHCLACIARLLGRGLKTPPHRATAAAPSAPRERSTPARERPRGTARSCPWPAGASFCDAGDGGNGPNCLQLQRCAESSLVRPLPPCVPILKRSNAPRATTTCT